MAEKSETLFVQGRPVVSLAETNLQLEPGELSAEQRKQLGDKKVASLIRGGHLKTQEQLDEEERLRKAASDRASDPHDPNPNYGTPSMTPEVLAQQEKSREADGANAPSPTATTTELRKRPVTDLDVSEPTVAALQKQGFKTIGDILAFGETNGGLAGKVDGIGEARETEVKEAISKLAKK